MKVKINEQVTEQRLRDFEFSGKAKENANLLLPKELDEIEREFMLHFGKTQIIWDIDSANDLFSKYFDNVLCYLNYCSLEEFYHNRAILHNYDRINVVRCTTGNEDEIEDICSVVDR